MTGELTRRGDEDTQRGDHVKTDEDHLETMERGLRGREACLPLDRRFLASRAVRKEMHMA